MCLCACLYCLQIFLDSSLALNFGHHLYRDRAPFVLTRDMAYVINDGDKPTAKFQQFCDLCCSAYNELRKHTTLFVSLLSLVSQADLTAYFAYLVKGSQVISI